MIKSNSYIEFLLKKNKLNYKLENNAKSDFLPENFHNCIKIFIGYDNDSLVAKTEYSKDLNNLNKDVEIHLKKINYRFESFNKDYIMHTKRYD